MTTKKKKAQNIRVNITLDEADYQTIVGKAKADYAKVATWIKQFLLRNMFIVHHNEPTSTNPDETDNM